MKPDEPKTGSSGREDDGANRRRSQWRLERINEVLLALGPDFDRNVLQLTALCGELFGAAAVAYKRLEGEHARLVGGWNLPDGFPDTAEGDGHLCEEVIRRANAVATDDAATLDATRPLVASARDGCPHRPGGVTPPCLAGQGFAGYVGQPIRAHGRTIGALALFFRDEVRPGAEDERLLGILAASFTAEEERRDALAALRESEAKFSTTFRKNPLPMAITAIDGGRIIDVNEAFLDIHGLQFREVIGRRTIDLGLWDDPSVREAIVRDIASTGEARNHPVLLRTRDGQLRDYLFSAERILLGSEPRLLSTVQDVTELRRAQRDLVRSEAKFSGFFKKSPLPMAISDLESGHIVDANEEFRTFLGRTSADIIGRTTVELGIWPDERSHRLFIEALTVAENLRGIAVRLPSAEGGRRVLLYSAERILIDGVPYALKAVEEITDLIRTQDQLAEREAQTRALFDQTLDPILLIEPETGALVDFNRAAHDSLGYDRETFARLTLFDIESFEGGKAAFDLLDLMVRVYAGEEAAYEARHRTKDGESRERLIRLCVVLRGGKRLLQSVCHDVTDERRTAALKAEMELQLFQMQKMESIGALAGGIAHDFNNLLAPIIGYAEMFIQDLREGDPRQSEAAQIVKAAERGRDLVRQLLAFSRRQILEVKPLDLARVIEGFQRILRRTIRENVRIEYRLAEGLPTLLGDAAQMEQILLNLSVNAQDAMPSGGLLVIAVERVDLEAGDGGDFEDLKPGPHIKLSVSDSGQGIDPAVLPRIFEPFYTTKERGKGTGLGLSTVFGIVKQHEGHIHAYSEPGHGTVFTLYLPVTDHAVPEPSAALPDPAAERATTGDETILVVEDDELVRDMLVAMLNRKGYRVRYAESGEEGIGIVETTGLAPDLLITDIMMPGMDGRELLRRLTASHPTLAALFMSGYSAEMVSHQEILDDGIDFIQKPFSLKVMARRVREILDRKGSAPPPGPRPAAEPVRPAQPTGADPARPAETVAVADDDELVLEMAVAALRKQGYQVIAGADADDCERKIAESGARPALLLTDIMMPGRNGRELYESLLARHPGLKVVYMSGYSTDVISNRGILEPGTDFIQKPFAVKTLARKIREALDGGETR